VNFIFFCHVAHRCRWPASSVTTFHFISSSERFAFSVPGLNRSDGRWKSITDAIFFCEVIVLLHLSLRVAGATRVDGYVPWKRGEEIKISRVAYSII
jgi:hypothetical protein